MTKNIIYGRSSIAQTRKLNLFALLLSMVLQALNLSQSYAAVSQMFGDTSYIDYSDIVAPGERITGINLAADFYVDSIEVLTNNGSFGVRGYSSYDPVYNITLAANEDFVGIFGTYGYSLYNSTTTIGKLGFVTSTGRVLGPFGSGGDGTDAVSFNYTAPAGESIDGFNIQAFLFVSGIGVHTSASVNASPSLPVSSLKGKKPPSVPGLTSSDTSRTDIITPVVINKSAAIALGKALFWDQGIGSDHQACASCHFHAGVDFRVKNQVSPGLNHANTIFNPTRSGSPTSGPNYTLRSADFPLDPDNDDTITSAGTFAGTFQKIGNGLVDSCGRTPNPIFNVNGVGTRKVEPRNSPTMINAAYNFRNFWDGRANNVFNGVNPFGLRDKTAGIYINVNSVLVKRPINLKNSSLASQAVGPVLSDFEMSCVNRQFADVGRKVLPRRPLDFQAIDTNDSVLKNLPALIGSTGTYADLVKKAFNPAYWNVNCTGGCGKPADNSAPYTQIEANFPLYFGLAVQLYEETLVSDDSKFDRWKDGTASLTSEEKKGFEVFNGKGKCVACHGGPVFTSAALEINKTIDSTEQVISRMKMKDSLVSIYDEGFYNIGVVPTNYDIGVGGLDPWSNPLSFSKQYQSRIFVDKFSVDACKFPEKFSPNCSASRNWSSERIAVMGNFKTPSLRNVELTGPFFHNGSQATLEQVVEFYNHGGNFDNVGKSSDVTSLGLSDSEKAALVAFLKTLTDERVAYEKAPFDHPALIVPHGHVGNQTSVTPGNDLAAVLGKDEWLTIPAVGSSGSATRLKPFSALLTP